MKTTAFGLSVSAHNGAALDNTATKVIRPLAKQGKALENFQAYSMEKKLTYTHGITQFSNKGHE